MILIDNFTQVVAQIESERGVTKEVLIDAMKVALVSACKRKFITIDNLEVDINPNNGEMRIYAVRNVVTKVTDEEIEISVKNAKKISSEAKKGETVRVEVTPKDFGRIAAQTAKQVIIQRIREAEKDGIYNEFKAKEGDIVTGTVQRQEYRNYLINLGRVEALLLPSEQIPGESYLPRDHIKVYIAEARKTSKGPVIHVSRSHPGLLKKLFELEVPEIHEGIIEIVNISREPGRRSKVAVKTNDPDIGAIGTCVGHMGSRINAIIKELGNEKIDIVEYNDNPRTYISNSLKPAKISKVLITDDDKREAIVIVQNDQLSLAIGKAGQNVRLAAKLTEWKIDILNEDEYKSREDEISKLLQQKMKEKIAKDKATMEQKEEKIKKPIESKKSTKAKKIKVKDLAKELNVANKELVTKTKDLGIEVKSGASSVTEEESKKIKESFKKE